METSGIQAKSPMNLLEQSCGKKFGNIIFDSDIDSANSKEFNQVVENKRNLCFINFSKDKIFGVFIEKEVNDTFYFTQDRKHFLFSIENNHLTKLMPKKNDFSCCAIELFENNNTYIRLDVTMAVSE